MPSSNFDTHLYDYDRIGLHSLVPLGITIDFYTDSKEEVFLKCISVLALKLPRKCRLFPVKSKLWPQTTAASS